MNTPSSSDGRPPKRFRIGTKSCAECRRRKVRCDYPTNSQICTGCSLHGVECVPQQIRASRERGIVVNGQNTQARLAGLERMVRQLCEAVDIDAGSSFSDIVDAAKSLKAIRSSSSTTEVASPDKFSELSRATAENDPECETFENAPLLGLFREALNLQQSSNPESHDKRTRDDPLVKSCLRLLNKYIPTARDLSLILDKTGYFLNVCYAVPMDMAEDSASRERFIVDSLKLNDRLGLARGVLCIALSVQQLPRDFCSEQVTLPCPQTTFVDEYISCAETLLASVETASPTQDGLLCLMLLSKVYTDTGKPRKSWLCLRRALNLSIILGFHHLTSGPHQAELWSQIWQRERQLGLSLGFPYGISNSELQLSADSTPETRFQHRVGLIVGRIIDRNQNSDSDYSVTQLIDQDLKRCRDEMPPGWWDAPTDTLEPGPLFIFQAMKIGYWNYVKLLHLPYMLKPINGSNTSKIKALDASRNVLKCYLTVRRGREVIACDIMDFQAFCSAVVLIINLLSSSDEENIRDFAKVTEMCDTFKWVSEVLECSVASQAAQVLDYLLRAYEGKYQDPNGYEATIPYFGRVKIKCIVKPTISFEPTIPYDEGIYWNAVEFNANPFLTPEELRMGEYLSNQELGMDWTSFNWDGNYEWSQSFEIPGVV